MFVRFKQCSNGIGWDREWTYIEIYDSWEIKPRQRKAIASYIEENHSLRTWSEQFRGFKFQVIKSIPKAQVLKWTKNNRDRIRSLQSQNKRIAMASKNR